MTKVLKTLMGLLLLPFCYAATRTLINVIVSIRPPSYSELPLSVWGLALGFGLWLFLFLALPRPVRTYVLAHELTHALWGALMGARVARVKVSKKGGSVQLSKNNFLITLAPYFFPFYTVLAIAGYYLLSIFFDLRAYEPFWLGLIGLTWGFHLTFTVTMLLTHQPDIQENGWLFSYAVIYLFNALGVGLWIVMVASPTLEGFTRQLESDIAASWLACWEAGRYAGQLIQQRLTTGRTGAA
ncbi:MAG TPA: hypothetical protein DCZ95_13355 [Verrucomicrobia bacterium]|nr:MAG: hypothetical protein A2X46_11215 [Lentisphaerae bacterium GWF2_57_35]HBA85073.1 hypothetical protein [Verrucomicrobiota bacterium]